MKFIATLVIAAVFASAIVATEGAPAKSGKGVEEAMAAKAKKLQAQMDRAFNPGKAKAGEIHKQHKPDRELALAKLNELKAQIDAKLKEVVNPADGKAKKQALKLKEKLIKEIEASQAKLKTAQ